MPTGSETTSPYFIPGLESDLQVNNIVVYVLIVHVFMIFVSLQPISPVADNAESQEVYRQYRIVSRR